MTLSQLNVHLSVAGPKTGKTRSNILSALQYAMTYVEDGQPPPCIYHVGEHSHSTMMSLYDAQTLREVEITRFALRLRDKDGADMLGILDYMPKVADIVVVDVPLRRWTMYSVPKLMCLLASRGVRHLFLEDIADQ